MKKIRLDLSIVCFALVLLSAIPVTTLRSKTYALGYELAELKARERELHRREAELQAQLVRTQRQVRDKMLSRSGNAKSLEIAAPASVIHSRTNAHE